MKKNPNSHPHQTLHSVGKMKKDLAAPGKARAPAVCIYISISLHMWHMCSIVDWALMLDPMTKQVENMDSALHPLNVWPINFFSHWKTEYLNHLTVNSSSFIITKPLTQEPMISPWCSIQPGGVWRMVSMLGRSALLASSWAVTLGSKLRSKTKAFIGSFGGFRHSSLENGIYERRR